MYIGAVLLCQAPFAHPTLFPVLMPSPCLVLKILRKLKTADAEARERTDDDGRERSASPSEDTQSGHPKGI